MAIIHLNSAKLPPELIGHACVDRRSLPRFFPTIWQSRKLGNGKLSKFNLRKLRSIDRFHDYGEEIIGISMDKLIAAQSWDQVADAATGFFAHLVNEARSTRTDLNGILQAVVDYLVDLAGWAAEDDGADASSQARIFLHRFCDLHGPSRTNRVRNNRKPRKAE
ncbi:hypothetical protein [Rhizobium sp. BK176]|uniref:hypothetical protein n=1 Tax=Rhizobium sp. BK176 TaxID=2587071 RepID=UPI002169112D|nr:hypothetical protein [Rhizobium sp. BK176]MCS4088933.1 hypothetical protein [Rhizobium sp. BK176]